MIRSEKQYRITKAQVHRFQDALAEMARQTRPDALIRARIAAGLTQEGLARRLGVKPQQVQRYESTDYQSASFARIVKVVQALGLKMPKAARLVRSG